jgi:hypothetical protein
VVVAVVRSVEDARASLAAARLDQIEAEMFANWRKVNG